MTEKITERPLNDCKEDLELIQEDSSETAVKFTNLILFR